MTGNDVNYWGVDCIELKDNFEVHPGAEFLADFKPYGKEVHHWMLTDHLSSVRTILDDDGNILSDFSYYPYGLRWDYNDSPDYEWNRVGALEQDGIQNHIDLMAYRACDRTTGMFTGVDPLADDPDLVAWSPYTNVWNNPINFFDPDGMKGTNEYVKDLNTGEVVQVGDKGGDETDYIYEGTIQKNDEGKIAGATYTENDNGISVETMHSSGIDTRFTQGADPTPGERNIHGSIPLDVKAYVFLTNLFSGGGASATLGIASKSSKIANSSKKLSKVKKTKVVESFGDYTKTTKVIPGKGPGQSRSVMTYFKNATGRVVRSFKDSYDRANKFIHRKPLRGGPEGRPPNG